MREGERTPTTPSPVVRVGVLYYGRTAEIFEVSEVDQRQSIATIRPDMAVEKPAITSPPIKALSMKMATLWKF